MSLVRPAAARPSPGAPSETPSGTIRTALACLALATVSTPAAAQRFDAAGDPVLTSGRWSLLSVPADASAASLATLFGDELSPALHAGSVEAGSGTRPVWVVYTYDADARAYVQPGVDEALVPGQAFWIIQITGADVTLDLPDGLPAVVGAASDACGVATGCIGIDLPVDAERASYAMLGSPTAAPLEVPAVRFATTDPEGAEGQGTSPDPCTGGCDLPAAAALGYTFEGVWAFDPDAGVAGAYTVAADAATLPPWTGFWTVTAPSTAALAPRLLLPAPAAADTGAVTVAGRVTTPDGVPVALARVGLANDPDGADTAGSDGAYSVRVPSGADPLLRVETPAHTRALLALDGPPPGAALALDVAVLERSAAGAFDAGEAIEHVGAGGGFLGVDPSDLRIADGAAHAGPVSVTLTALDTSNRAAREALPGDFAGIDGTGATVPVASLGAAEIVVTDAAGAELVPAEGAAVSLVMPLAVGVWPDGGDVLEGDAVPLWRLDASAARWRRAGEGRVIPVPASPTGLGLAATVDRFSWWKAGPALPAARVALEIAGEIAGTASVSASPTGPLPWLTRSAGTVLRVGETRDGLAVPADTELCWTADIVSDAGAAGVAGPTCLTLPAGVAGTVRLVVPDDAAPFAVTAGARLAQEGSLEVGGSVGAPLEPVRLGVSRLSGAVTYAVTAGELPPGTTLVPSGTSGAVLTGRADATGTWEAVLTATAADGATSDLAVRYTLGDPPTDDIPFPPERDGFAAFDIDVPDPSVDATYRVELASRFDPVSDAVSWSVEPEGEGISVGADGALTLDYRAGDIDDFPPVYRWGGRVTATDSVATQTLEVELYLESDDFVPAEDP